MINRKNKLDNTHCSYTKITSRLATCLDELPAEDKTNLTNTKRKVKKYNEKLNTDIEQIILQLAKRLGRKVNLLDAGCGSAVAIDELLSNKELASALNTCTGISLHYFNNIKQVMEKHGERFIYYKGSAQEVLKKMHNQIDIIIDVWGAYCYSEDKIGLLKLYHQALTPYGDAEVFIKNQNTLIILDENHKMNLDKICDQYPDTFTKHEHKYDTTTLSAITLIKNSERFPLPNCSIKSYQEVRTINSPKDLEALRKGNAVRPDKVKYTPSETGYNLRSLSYK